MCKQSQYGCQCSCKTCRKCNQVHKTRITKSLLRGIFLKQPQYTGKGYFMNPNANRLFLYHGRLPETHITEDEERLFQAEPRADIIARKPEYR